MDEYVKSISSEEKPATMPNSFWEAASKLAELYEYQYDQLKPCVDRIIDGEIRDMAYIEKILELLLDAPSEPCRRLFTRLCEYVSKFNSPFAKEYGELWHNLYEEEEEKELHM